MIITCKIKLFGTVWKKLMNTHFYECKFFTLKYFTVLWGDYSPVG